jgi:hypothetical protein
MTLSGSGRPAVGRASAMAGRTHLQAPGAAGIV